jgi:hypothetical protein
MFCATSPFPAFTAVQKLNCIHFYPIIESDMFKTKSQTSGMFNKTVCCSSCNVGTGWVSVSVKDISLESCVSNCLFIGIDSEIEGEGMCRGEGNNNEMRHMWLNWRRLIRKNLEICSTFQFIERSEREKSYILCELYIWQLQCNSTCLFIPNHKPTVYPPLRSSTVLSQCDTCHWHLKIFIDVMYPAVHSRLLTAYLLWYWRLTRPLLCRICAGVDRSGATDIKGKHVGSFGSSGWLTYRQCRQCRHCRPRRHCKQCSQCRHCRPRRHSKQCRQCRQCRHCRQRIIKLQALEAIQATRAILAKALQAL